MEIEKLIIENNVDKFLFSSRSEFYDLCSRIVSALKEKYPHIKPVYVRAEYPYINEDYEKYLLKVYDETYYSEKIIGGTSSLC